MACSPRSNVIEDNIIAIVVDNLACRVLSKEQRLRYRALEHMAQKLGELKCKVVHANVGSVYLCSLHGSQRLGIALQHNFAARHPRLCMLSRSPAVLSA